MLVSSIAINEIMAADTLWQRLMRNHINRTHINVTIHSAEVITAMFPYRSSYYTQIKSISVVPGVLALVGVH